MPDDSKRWFALALLCLTGFMIILDASIVLVAVPSLLCGFAWTGDALVFARGLQGIAAAVLAPSALSIVMTTFPDGAERNKALGIWGATSGVGGTAGSLIGGPVTDGLGWQWIFFINVPVCVLVVALAPVLLKDSRGPGRRGFDFAGALTVTAALIVLVYAVVEAPTSSAGRTTLLALASAVLFALFVLVEKRFGLVGTSLLVGRKRSASPEPMRVRS